MTQDIGIDLHKTKSFLTRLDRRGRVREQVDLTPATGELAHSLHALPPGTPMAVEATGNWMWLYELIEERHPDVVFAHPLRTKAMAPAVLKTISAMLKHEEAFWPLKQETARQRPGS